MSTATPLLLRQRGFPLRAPKVQPVELNSGGKDGIDMILWT